jgi:hypothetical protein
MEEEFSDDWMSGIGREWAAELSDPREDIYALEDGMPMDGPGCDMNSMLRTPRKQP